MSPKQDPSSNTRVKSYETPRITTISSAELLATISPASAIYGTPPNAF